jgi:hypothetical protein
LSRNPRRTSAAVCPRCKKRLAKRACPALGLSICQLCCGNLREKEIHCPSSCAHLTAHKSYQQKRIVERRPSGSSPRPRARDVRADDERLGWLGLHVEAALLRHAAGHPDFSDADALAALDDARGKIEKEPPRLIVPGEAVRTANEAGELILKAAGECRFRTTAILESAAEVYKKDEKIACLDRIILGMRPFLEAAPSGRTFLQELAAKFAQAGTPARQKKLITLP